MNKLLGESNELISPLTIYVQACKFTRTLLLCSMGTVFKSDWLPTKVNDTILADYVKTGNLDPEDVIGWRTGFGEDLPNPKEGEIVVFVEHLERGFKPPGSNSLEKPCLS